MNCQELKIIFVEIFIIMLVKCITATPVHSQVQMGTDVKETETFKEERHPSVPPWAQANGLGKHKQIVTLRSSIVS